MLPALNPSPFFLPTSAAQSTFRREFDEMFDRFLHDLPANGNGGIARRWHAPVAIWDDNNHVYVEVEVPGLSQDDLGVIVHQGNLHIWGERNLPDDRNYWHNERTYGRFERRIALPDVVDPDSINAQMCAGILSVMLHKKPEAQPKKVAIRAE